MTKHSYVKLRNVTEIIPTESLFLLWAYRGLVKSFYYSDSIREADKISDYTEANSAASKIILPKNEAPPKSFYKKPPKATKGLFLAGAGWRTP